MNNIEVFLKASTFAVAGASQDRSKYGNKVFRANVASGRTVYPLNPTATEVEGDPAFATISELVDFAKACVKSFLLHSFSDGDN